MYRKSARFSFICKLLPVSFLLVVEELLEQKLKETIYTPDSGIKNPVKIIVEIIRDMGSANALGLRLAKRNIRSLYRQSLLGYLWSILPPVFTSLVWIFLNRQSIVNIQVPDVPYPLFILTGTLLWQIFVESVTAPIKSVQSSAAILAKINFPRESLILSGIYEVLFNTVIKILLILIILFYFQVTISYMLAFALIGILALIVLGSSIGLILTPIGMLYTDISRGINIILQFAIYLTPVIYSEPQTGFAGKLMKFNPVAPLLTATRNFFLNNSSVELSSFCLVSVFAIVLFFIGIFIYKIAMPIIIERIGS